MDEFERQEHMARELNHLAARHDAAISKALMTWAQRWPEFHTHAPSIRFEAATVEGPGPDIVFADIRLSIRGPLWRLGHVTEDSLWRTWLSIALRNETRLELSIARAPHVQAVTATLETLEATLNSVPLYWTDPTKATSEPA